MSIRDKARANLLQYTRRAFEVLPGLDHPRILDIGCGAGLATLEVAKISGGQIVAVDIDRDALRGLCERFKQEGLEDRIETCHSSMRDLNFPSESFNIIWSEGAIANIRFEDGLRGWKRLLVPGGHLVIHDVLTDLEKKMQIIRTSDYTLLDHFVLKPDVWWREYYLPLSNLVNDVGSRDDDALESVNGNVRTIIREIEQFNADDERFGSVFFVLKKHNQDDKK